MKTDPHNEPTTIVFLQTVLVAVTQLKRQLQYDYQQAYPELREVIDLVLDEEEARAWDLTLFPHLLLPDLVEAHIATLNLRPLDTKHADAFALHRSQEIKTYEASFTLCG
jgi:hypothetical protein